MADTSTSTNNTPTNNTTHTIDHTIAPKLLEWFNAGRGVTCWHLLEIGTDRARQIFAPADPTTAPNNLAPHWAYGNPEQVTMSMLNVDMSEEVETFTGRFKRMYWGPYVQPGTERRAQARCVKHGLDKDSWTFEYVGDGLVLVRILKPVLVPFEQWVKGGK